MAFSSLPRPTSPASYPPKVGPLSALVLIAGIACAFELSAPGVGGTAWAQPVGLESSGDGTPVPKIGVCTDRAAVLRAKRAKGEQVDLVPPPRKGFALQFSAPGAVTATDITEPVSRRVTAEQKFRPTLFSFNDLLYYYESNLSVLKRLYPAGTFSIDPRQGLQSYSGSLQMEMDDVFRLPFLPISPIIDEPFDLNVQQLETEYEGRKVPGMRARVTRNRPATQTCPNTNFFVYMPDINAKILGFSYARFVPELSENVITNQFFHYNALLPWSAHSRLKREDQVQGVALSNFAHAGPASYVISAHPDFALDIYDPSVQLSLMTFYLWKKEPPSPDSTPDFVYQIEVHFTQPAPAIQNGTAPVRGAGK